MTNETKDCPKQRYEWENRMKPNRWILVDGFKASSVTYRDALIAKTAAARYSANAFIHIAKRVEVPEGE